MWCSDIVSALRPEYIVMVATVYIVIIMLKMSLPDEKLLKLLWNAIQMHFGLK